MNRPYYLLKTFVLLIAFFLLIAGWEAKEGFYSFTAAILYLVMLLYELVLLIIELKKNKRQNSKEEKEPKTLFQKIAISLEAVIMFSGLIAYGLRREPLMTSGMIIWIGTIIIYFLSGLVFKTITGIPLKMGYGGWYSPSKKRQKK